MLPLRYLNTFLLTWLEAHEHRQDPGENGRRIEKFIGENEHLSQIIGGRPVYCQKLINGGRRGKVTWRYKQYFLQKKSLFVTEMLRALPPLPPPPPRSFLYLLLLLLLRLLLLFLLLFLLLLTTTPPLPINNHSQTNDYQRQMARVCTPPSTRVYLGTDMGPDTHGGKNLTPAPVSEPGIACIFFF